MFIVYNTAIILHVTVIIIILLLLDIEYFISKKNSIYSFSNSKLKIIIIIIIIVCKKLKFDQTNKWYMHNPLSVLENVTHKLLWDFKIQTDHLISAWRPDLIISKVGDHSQRRPEGSLLLHWGLGKGTTPFLRLLHFTLDMYRIMLSFKQEGIKYHFLSLWCDSTWN